MKAELANLISEAELIAADAQTKFGALDEAQLNWQPDAANWSVGTCLEHLIITNDKEFQDFEKVVAGNYQNPFWGKIPFLSDFFGGYVLKAVQPENPKKWKTPKVFAPVRSHINASIVDEFIRHQQKNIDYFKKCENLDLRKTVITSPVSSVVTYRLLDALKILVVHERRHFAQAERVIQNENFPK